MLAGVLASFRVYHGHMVQHDKPMASHARLVHQNSVRRMKRRRRARRREVAELHNLDGVGETVDVTWESDEERPTPSATTPTSADAQPDTTSTPGPPSPALPAVASAGTAETNEEDSLAETQPTCEEDTSHGAGEGETGRGAGEEAVNDADGAAPARTESNPASPGEPEHSKAPSPASASPSSDAASHGSHGGESEVEFEVGDELEGHAGAFNVAPAPQAGKTPNGRALWRRFRLKSKAMHIFSRHWYVQQAIHRISNGSMHHTSHEAFSRRAAYEKQTAKAQVPRNSDESQGRVRQQLCDWIVACGCQDSPLFSSAHVESGCPDNSQRHRGHG